MIILNINLYNIIMERRSSVKKSRKTNRLSYTSQQKKRKSRRSETVSKKRNIKYKHILICGHGALPPEKKDGFYFLPHMDIGEKCLAGMNINLDEKLSSKSKVITGTLPGKSGLVFPDSNIILFKRVKSSVDKNKSLASIVYDLNDHPTTDRITKSEVSKLEWKTYAKAQPTDFYLSDENIIVYFHELQSGNDFHVGIYDIDNCDVDMDEINFSDIENSKCNISTEIFNELDKPYDEYFVEKTDNSLGDERSNYYMEATVWGDKTVGANGFTPEINDKPVRPLTVPLKYIEKAIRNHYKDKDLHIIFYSTICKSTPEERAMLKKKKRKKKRKSKKK